ncbi:hypothetical protein LIA77_02852 [Sarocladium implicatum]|nr:hypothetical protein LIA77_02852 [Sarocladium implicatum]
MDSMSMDLWAPFHKRKVIEHPHDLYVLRLEEVTDFHQRIDVNGTWEDQTHEGRPRRNWSPCLNPRCDSYNCLQPPLHHFGLRYKGRIKNGGNGTDLIWQTIDRLADIVWPGASNEVDKMSRHMILGSYFHSPLVMNAYIQFKMDIKTARVRINRNLVETAICQSTPFVKGVVTAPDSPETHKIVRWYLGLNYDDHQKQRSLADAVTKFMLSCEVWRQYPSARSRTWAFGSPRVVCDVLGGVLMGYRALDQLGLMVKTLVLGDWARNEAWKQWIQQYPLCAISDNPYVRDTFIVRSAARPDTVPGRAEAAVLAGVGYLGGVGTYDPTVKRKLTRRGAEISISNLI